MKKQCKLYSDSTKKGNINISILGIDTINKVPATISSLFYPNIESLVLSQNQPTQVEE